MLAPSPYVPPEPAKTRIILESARLVLRRPEPRDWPQFREFMLTDRSVYVRPPEAAENIIWRSFCHVLGMWEMRGYGLGIACFKGQDTALGGFGPWHPIDWPEPELGWAVYDPTTERTGIAFEAATAMRTWAYRALGWATAVSYIHPDNAASIRLAERLECRLDANAIYPGPPGGLVYRHPSPEALT